MAHKIPRGKKRIAPRPDMESVWGESEPVKTNMKIIDVASPSDSRDWCLRCDGERLSGTAAAASYLPVRE